MKKWFSDLVIGWLMLTGVVFGNVACICYDPNGSDYPLFVFYYSQAVCACCGLYFLWVKRTNTIALLGQFYFAFSWLFSCAKIMLGIGYDRSVIQLVVYFLTIGIITLYVATKRSSD